MITTQIKEFKTKSYDNAKFENSETYLKLARMQIVGFCKKHYPSYMNKLLNDDDAISYVAYANMLADWRFDESRNLARNTYRGWYANGFIKTYIRKNCKVPKVDSLDEMIQEGDNGKGFNLLELLGKQEKNNNQRWTAEDIQSCMDNLQPRSREILYMYAYDGMNLAEIGRKLNITRERVRQIVNNSLEKMKKELIDAEQE
jgi:RNA polymerase sigma factor (sigma-70 family)